MGWTHTRRPGVIARVVGEEALLLDTEAQRIHQLNATASFIWAHCERAQSAEALAALLAAAFEVNHATALRDVSEVVGKLHALGLLEND